MGDPATEALRQDELCNRNMCALANNFVDFRFTVFLDTDLVDRAELDFFIALMSRDSPLGQRPAMSPEARARVAGYGSSAN